MPNPGDLLIGRYRILERLGSGGMATVHRARDERLDRDVAVKILLPNLAGDPATAARFEREARSLAASSHPGVVAVFDVDAGDPAPVASRSSSWSCAAAVRWPTASAAGRPMAPDDLVPILVPIADGLADLHRRGHRPSRHQAAEHPLRRRSGEAGRLRARPVERRRGRRASSPTPGTTVGTLAYLAPEILAGERATAGGRRVSPSASSHSSR